jgi:hypothetical protein
MTVCAFGKNSGLVIDQTRKDGFRFRNVEETGHPSANRSSEEDPRVSNVPEIGEKERDEDFDKDKVQAPNG